MTEEKKNPVYETGETERVFRQMESVILEMARLHEKGQFYGWAGTDGRPGQERLWFCFWPQEFVGRKISGKGKTGWPAEFLAFLGSEDWQKGQAEEALMPVEAYMGRDVTGPWSDIYSICAVIYTRLTGQLPVGVKERVRGTILPLPSQLGIGISRGRERALMKGLELLPKDRWQNGRELYRELLISANESRRKLRGKHNILKRQGGGSVFSDHIYMLETGIRCSEIRAVTFLDSLGDMPEQRWDVSEKGDFSVATWAENEGDGYHFYIAEEGGVAANPDSSGLFQDCYRMKRVDFQNCFYTSEAKNMSAMFYNCASLTELDLRGFDTEKVTDMSYMFYNCSSLIRVDVTSFQTANVTDMSRMFFGCRELQTLDISGFDRRNVKNMEEMLTKTRWW